MVTVSRPRDLLHRSTTVVRSQFIHSTFVRIQSFRKVARLGNEDIQMVVLNPQFPQLFPYRHAPKTCETHIFLSLATQFLVAATVIAETAWPVGIELGG